VEIRARFSEKGLQTSDGYPLGRGVYPTLDELNGALAFQELIVFFRDGDIMLQGLKFVGFYGTSELLDEGMTPLPQFAGIFFCYLVESVIRTTLEYADSPSALTARTR
jgi:hypothetical protein